MLGKTARWLRILGFDTFYTAAPHVTDDDLLKIAKREDRILLTKDKSFFQKARRDGVVSVYLDRPSASEEVAELAELYEFKEKLISGANNFSRCPACNGILQVVSREVVNDRVPLGSLENFDEFWVCQTRTCGKIYWKGHHWDNITKELEKIRNISRIKYLKDEHNRISE